MGAQINGTELGRGGSLLKALANTGISVVYCDLDFRVVWAENVPSIWSTEPVEGRFLHEFLEEEASDQLMSTRKEVIASGVTQKVEICIPADDGANWFAVWVDSDRAPSGEVVGIMATAVDITDQKRREQTLRTLLREVAHRSKNLLAIIQSIATQTGRHSDSVDGFLSRFRGRLLSLASTQDLVTSSNWRGAALHDLVLGQVARYTADPSASIRIEGERPYLNPNAALHIGLALHELAVNSVSYGALARPDGYVTLTAHRVEDGPPALSLVWTEAISIADQAIGQKRFGSVALERVVPAALNGSSTLELASDRLTYSLIVPQGSFELE
ncbi:PAS domain-containing protein [Pseudaminobacter sp. 19-2017]|uniref:histidine kinase n=1 Tax=Pseudaminobacter soli (ex Zhang et al. 2022) TaxID=2831468 RepID=A0A942E0E2_9HYPH|nr:PAS domain-containing sensor histidine kinase [Pseudaminobacter soli]MBS3650542.1 PAS domain-containing protein [Pseudaminobacter soli]